MEAIEPIRITAGNFAAYGRYYNLRGEDGVSLADGQMFVSRERISGEPLKIGATGRWRAGLLSRRRWSGTFCPRSF